MVVYLQWWFIFLSICKYDSVKKTPSKYIETVIKVHLIYFEIDQVTGIWLNFWLIYVLNMPDDYCRGNEEY